MNKLSTDFIFVYKILLPIAVFGFLTFILLQLATNDAYAACIPVLAVACLVHFIFKKGPWKMADEVYEAGDYLVVRKGRIETRIPFEKILSVEIESYQPTKISVVFREPNEIGNRFNFIPREPISSDSESRNVVINLLRFKILDAS